ncbi:cobyric acid synthase [Petroclostridium sp. X23]|uniref:cobyric acid synthase n=1 Tax=Petroclostridium sp. X23 TaxID=3045146 RepID=UPI0024ADB745|nr:cobyric acid synthase [Petroclostridium sp. X23]WHH58538.1 cobyric acid synthase [Petroclostridium sp. X23]
MKGKCIMLQGTGSSVGKSLLTTALCRIFKQDGYKVAPFKSQNMALNSYITNDGKEMGRAQVVQAEACGLEPSVEMNPILLKPTTDRKAQVIVMGEVLRNMSAVEYHEFKPQLAQRIKEAYDQLEAQNDIVVLEGAGSPAEINLRDKDIVNMGMAEMADAPVVLIGDIDKGGVFASLAGTMLLLTEEEKKRVKGVIINKFRGDVKILEPGLRMLEDIIKVPVLGVIPYGDINIEDEDSVSERFQKKTVGSQEIEIAIIRLPHISNFTDFVALENQPDVSIRYISKAEQMGEPDILIIPGSKNTIEDMAYLRESGLERKINDLHQNGKLIIGICGGYQMLGREIHDPLHTESNLESIRGLNLLNLTTTFESKKVTTRVKAKVYAYGSLYLQGLDEYDIEGYEIHMGISKQREGCRPLTEIVQRLDKCVTVADGFCNDEGNVFGTYIHGIFDNTKFLRGLLNNVREKKGLGDIKDEQVSFKEFKEREYDKIAQMVREHLDMHAIYKIVKGIE